MAAFTPCGEGVSKKSVWLCSSLGQDCPSSWWGVASLIAQHSHARRSIQQFEAMAAAVKAGAWGHSGCGLQWWMCVCGGCMRWGLGGGVLPSQAAGLFLLCRGACSVHGRPGSGAVGLLDSTQVFVLAMQRMGGSGLRSGCEG